MDVILIILAIIGGLAGFLKDKSDENSSKPKRSFNTPKPPPTPSGGSNTSTSGTPVTNSGEQTTVNTATIEEQQEEQRKRLVERMETSTYKARTGGEHDAVLGNTVKEPDKDLSMEQKRLKKRIKTNLNQKGLVNGIIMSEVLGPPRANKPYRSVVSQRRK